ncbi:hypothetical protein KAM471c_00990 [Aeromonas caviae]|nr:hypothetical protein [Aeromonas caviae]BDN86284.1 hypothetical protein KAM471c_00990 [Aeromonas caviae]
MAKKSKPKGYTTDLTLSWIAEDLGPDWLQWQQYGTEWLAQEQAGMSL